MGPHPIDEVTHRPWPLPRAPWIMEQHWHDLLFAHWAVSPDHLRRLVPPVLELDTFRGETWLGVTPFRMSGVRLRFMPALPWLSSFPELNVRTYVRLGGKAGVYFFSLDAGNLVAVETARRLFHLPYYLARMSLDEVNGEIRYRSERRHHHALSAFFSARYRPTGAALQAARGSLEHWLTERYCLYTLDARERPLRLEIHHRPWALQPASAIIEAKSMAAASGIELPETTPVLHFARRLDVLVWAPERADAQGTERARA